MGRRWSWTETPACSSDSRRRRALPKHAKPSLSGSRRGITLSRTGTSLPSPWTATAYASSPTRRAPGRVIEALAQGAEGLASLRTELLFPRRFCLAVAGAAGVKFLKPILAELSGRTATIRLLDFGGDKTPPFLRGTNERGVELMLRGTGSFACSAFGDP